MAVTVLYRDEAVDDITEAMQWYRAQKAGLEQHFLSSVLECEKFLLQFPKGAPVIHKHLRQTPLKGFPCVMLFGVWHGDLVICRNFHTSQHPKKKLKRKM